MDIFVFIRELISLLAAFIILCESETAVRNIAAAISRRIEPSSITVEKMKF